MSAVVRHLRYETGKGYRPLTTDGREKLTAVIWECVIVIVVTRLSKSLRQLKITHVGV